MPLIFNLSFILQTFSPIYKKTPWFYPQKCSILSKKSLDFANISPDFAKNVPQVPSWVGETPTQTPLVTPLVPDMLLGKKSGQSIAGRASWVTTSLALLASWKWNPKSKPGSGYVACLWITDVNIYLVGGSNRSETHLKINFDLFLNWAKHRSP